MQHVYCMEHTVKEKPNSVRKQKSDSALDQAINRELAYIAAKEKQCDSALQRSQSLTNMKTGQKKYKALSRGIKDLDRQKLAKGSVVETNKLKLLLKTADREDALERIEPCLPSKKEYK